MIILTKRETEILELIESGKTSKEIAKILNCSNRTVETHKTRMLAKTGAVNCCQLISMKYNGIYNVNEDI